MKATLQVQTLIQHLKDIAYFVSELKTKKTLCFIIFAVIFGICLNYETVRAETNRRVVLMSLRRRQSGR